MLRKGDTHHARLRSDQANGSPPSSARAPRSRHQTEVVPHDVEETPRRSLLPALTHAEAHRRGSSFPECPGGVGGACRHGAPMLIIAVLVRLDSPGPVIYRQPRVGINRRRRRGLDSKNRRRHEDRGGRIFMILKFRTMHGDAAAGQVWAAREDPRVTKVGRLLRATRLDELPQLVNVLMGDMNIVGPRPEQPEIFAELRSGCRPITGGSTCSRASPASRR